MRPGPGPGRGRAGAGHLHDLGQGAVRPLGDELHAGQEPRRDHLGDGPRAAAAQLPGQRRTWRGEAAPEPRLGAPRRPPARPAPTPRAAPPAPAPRAAGGPRPGPVGRARGRLPRQSAAAAARRRRRRRRRRRCGPMAGAGGGGAGRALGGPFAAAAFISRREPSGRRNVIQAPSRIFLSSPHIPGRPPLALSPVCEPPGRQGTARQPAGCGNGRRGRVPCPGHLPCPAGSGRRCLFILLHLPGSPAVPGNQEWELVRDQTVV